MTGAAGFGRWHARENTLKQPHFPSVDRFAQFVELRDLRPRTREAYISYAALIGRHHECDPESLLEAQVRDYLLFLRGERGYAASSMGVAFASLRCFYRDCLKSGSNWALWQEFKVRRTEPLPMVLTREEIARLIAATRCDRYRTVFTLLYHCGLRISEAVRLKVTDIREGNVHVRDGKGGKDRLVPISSEMVADLRRFWCRHRHPVWIFPGLTCAWKGLKQPLPILARAAKIHMSESAVQNGFRLALAASGINVARHPAHPSTQLRDPSLGGGRLHPAHQPVSGA